MKTIKTQKDGEAFIWIKTMFTLNMNTNKKYWTCVKRSCPTSVTNKDDAVIL